MTALISTFPKVKSGGREGEEEGSVGREERRVWRERMSVCSGCCLIMLLLVQQEHYEYKTHINTYSIPLRTLFIH
jgi:hypothetical protein